MIRLPFRAPRFDLLRGSDDAGRLLPWIVGLMAYLAAVGGIGLILLDDALRAWERPLSSLMTVQLPADISAARIEVVLASLRQTPGVVSAHLLDAAETGRLLEPWLGPSVPLDRLPLPRLVDLQIDPAAAIDFTALRQKLTSVAPGATLDESRPGFDAWRRAASRIEIGLAAVVVALAFLTVLSVVLIVHAGLAVHRNLVELLHLLGAADGDVARQFQVQALRHGLLGGAVGAGAAALTLLGLWGAAWSTPLPLPPTARGLADWRAWAVLAGIVPVVGILSMAAARITVLRRLARLP
jgi:cell division transport system permease protein